MSKLDNVLIGRREILRGSVAAAAALTLPVGQAFAKAPLAGDQAPSLFRLAVGSVEVTALMDGTLALPLDLYKAAGKEEAGRLLAAKFLPADAIPTVVNAYLVNLGDRLVLIDSGGTSGMAPTLGHVPAALKAAGVDPAAVDTILMTHLHPDHTGALTGSTKAAFPNAELVLSAQELAFWTDDAIMAKAGDGGRPFFMSARAALEPYKAAGRIRTFAKEGEVVSGITAIPAPGHTPGHSMYLIASGGKSLLVWGDIVHTPAIQGPHPEWAIAFDVDPDLAIQTRRQVFDRTATDKLLVAGMHIPFPGVVHVAKAGTGYDLVPTFWSQSL